MSTDTIDVLPQNSLDLEALERFVSRCLAEYGGGLRVRQFPGGFSNPTYALDAVDRQGRPRSYVLRKRPAGELLPSAHRVDREFRVLSALQDSGVPVPRARVLCDNERVLGQSFFIMDRVQGRLYPNPALPGCTPDQRRAIYGSMIEVLARLHAVDHRAVGLAGFGKEDGYLQRQVALWTRQYRAAQTDDLPDMDDLGDWLQRNVPEGTRTAIVHGDYRTNNLLLHPTEPRVEAVLDWELSTLGDPLCDVAYTCLCYYLPDPPVGFGGADPLALGIPSEDAFIAAYAQRAGLAEIPQWSFYVALQLYKSASLVQGVYKRGLEGKAQAAALDKHKDVRARAALGLQVAGRSKR